MIILFPDLFHKDGSRRLNSGRLYNDYGPPLVPDDELFEDLGQGAFRKRTKAETKKIQEIKGERAQEAKLKKKKKEKKHSKK